MNSLNVQQVPELRSAWSRYQPDDEVPWNLRRVVHLHRRAGFGATWGEIQRDLKEGPDKAIQRLIDGKSRMDGVPEDFESISAAIGHAAAAGRQAYRLKAWWLYRMLFGPDPLTEKLTLLWHNHFATSNSKVGDLDVMHRQNELFRHHARDSFGDLLNKVVRDPAMLVWLDAPSNRKGHPNENLARELMELFTLGVGHYSEADVREAARALTGWSIAAGEFRMQKNSHDDGEKTLFGNTGRWTGDDLVNMLLKNPATARRIAWRLCSLLMGETTLKGTDLETLASEIQIHNTNIGRTVKTVMCSRLFFSNSNLGTRISGPVEFVISVARTLELFDPPASTVVLSEWTDRLGQTLFYPPNVGGWSEGKAWLNGRTALGRVNFAAALVEGELSLAGDPIDPLRLAKKYELGQNSEQVVRFYVDLLLGGEPAAGWTDRLLAKLKLSTVPNSKMLRRAIAAILSSPEAQLC